MRGSVLPLSHCDSPSHWEPKQKWLSQVNLGYEKVYQRRASIHSKSCGCDSSLWEWSLWEGSDHPTWCACLHWLEARTKQHVGWACLPTWPWSKWEEIWSDDYIYIQYTDTNFTKPYPKPPILRWALGCQTLEPARSFHLHHWHWHAPPMLCMPARWPWPPIMPPVPAPTVVRFPKITLVKISRKRNIKLGFHYSSEATIRH